MPIARTYMCPECAHRMEVILSADEWEAPPPPCEACDARAMRQEFKPPAIGGSIGGKARAIAEDIIANDYGVANITFQNREGNAPKVRYKDQSNDVRVSSWGTGQIANALETAKAIGQQTRRDGGATGIEVLARSLDSGAQPDLIAASKRRAIRVW